MTSDRKKPGVAFWATVVVVAVLVGYPLSFGPACWISSRVNPSGKIVSVIYLPILWALVDGPDWLQEPIERYAWMGSSTRVMRVSFDYGISFE
jgi:hypothetical protein